MANWKIKKRDRGANSSYTRTNFRTSTYEAKIKKTTADSKCHKQEITFAYKQEIVDHN